MHLIRELKVNRKYLYAYIIYLFIHIFALIPNIKFWDNSDAGILLGLAFTRFAFNYSGYSVLESVFSVTSIVISIFFYLEFFTEDFEKSYVYLFTRFINIESWLNSRIKKLAKLSFFQVLISVITVGVISLVFSESIDVVTFVQAFLEVLVWRFLLIFTLTFIVSALALKFGETIALMLLSLGLFVSELMTKMFLREGSSVGKYLHNILITSHSNYLWSVGNVKYENPLTAPLINIPQFNLILSIMFLLIVVVVTYLLFIRFIEKNDSLVVKGVKN